jgi:transposase
MARVEQLKLTPTERQTRYFSEEFKRKKVEEIEKKVSTIAEICREYAVSATSVYKWIYRYSVMRKKGVKMVVESASDTTKIESLKRHIAELEQLLGQKQFEVEFLEKQMQKASEQYGIDFKKKRSGQRSSGSGSIEKPTDTK